MPIRKLKQLPDEFYIFWNTEKKILLDKKNEKIQNFVTNIDEMLFYKSVKNATRIKKKNLSSKPSNEYLNLYKSKNPSTKSLPSIIGLTKSNSNFKYETYSLKSQFSQNEKDLNNYLSNSPYIDEDEIEGQNIHRDDNKEIHYISFNLLLKKIAFDKIFEFSEINKNDVVLGLVQQYSSFITTETLVDKITEAINYYFEKQNVIAFNLISLLNMIVIKHFNKEIRYNTNIKNTLLDKYLLYIQNEQINSHFKEIFDEIIIILESDDEEEINASLLNLSNRKRRNIVITRSIKKKVSISSCFMNPINNKLMDWKPREIAKELTYITTNMINKIDETELLYHNFNSSSKKIQSPNIVSLIERFDKLSYFLIEEILSYDKKKYRAAMIEKFIQVANELDKLRNYNDCMNIKSCLNHFIIKNLRKTWKKVDHEYIEMFNNLNKKYSFEKNFSNLRNELKKCQQSNLSYIPYFGLVLKDICFTEEGCKYLNREKLINVEKIKKIQGIIENFFQFKQNSLFMRHILGLEILSELEPKDEKELEKIANCIEPVFTLAKKKITVKRMTKTDIALINKNKNNFIINSSLCRSKRNSYDTEDTSMRYDDEDDGYEGDYDTISTIIEKNKYIFNNPSKNKLFLLQSDRKETK